MADNHRLVMAQGPQPGQAFPLDKDTILLGRAPHNDIVINHPQVSREHARITRQGEVMVIEDLGSTNGTLIDGTRLTGPHVLANGDVIGLGEAMTLTYHEPETAATEAAVEQPAAPPSAPPGFMQRPAHAAKPALQPAHPAIPPRATPRAQRGGLTRWLWVGLGCLTLVLAGACVAVLLLAYLGLLPPALYEPLRWLGLI